MGQRIVVFDLDHTLIAGNSSYSFCKVLYQHKILSFWTLLRATWYRFLLKATSARLRDLHDKVFTCLLKGRLQKELESFTANFIDSILVDNLYFPAFQELRLWQHRGAHTVIMSSSPSFLVEPIAQVLGVDECFSTRYSLDTSGKIESVESFLDGETKAETLKSLIAKKTSSFERVVVYSDSYHDLPLLKVAGEAIVVNPDKILRSVSLEKQWRAI